MDKNFIGVIERVCNWNQYVALQFSLQSIQAFTA